MLSVALSITISMPLSFAAVSDSSNLYCSDGKVLVYRLNSDKYACLNPPSAEKWYKSGIAEPVEQIMSEQKEISAEFPFESHYVEVLGSKMHYIDEGQGDPILFIHGNPTSSYLWRNIIPYVSDDGRAIAVDLIGMGKSDKPDIDYRFVDHAKYLEAFIDELELQNVTLVIHDWGSGLGLNYAMNNEDNIKGIAMMEALLFPMTWDDFPSTVIGISPSPLVTGTNEMKEMFQNFRTPGVGEELIMNQNIFIEQFLDSAVIRDLSEEEMNQYREPYPTPEDRKPIWVWPNEIPINGEPADVHEIVSNYNQWIQETPIPKLLIHATPGIITTEEAVQWSNDNLKNLKTVNVGPGLHYIQEDAPDEIGEAISDWYQTLKSESASMFEVHPEKMRTAAPLPETARGPQIDFSKGYLVEEIKDGLYWVTDGAYNTIFLTTGEGVIVVDAPPSIGENYLNAIAEVTEEPITHVIYSHTHRDHIGAANIFPDDAVIISHKDVASELEQRNDPNRPIPEVTFDDEYLLEVGNQSLELKYDGPMHVPGNIFIYAPQQKVLMVVDVIFPGWTPFKDLAMAQDVPAFLAAHDKILEYDFDTYVGGHLTRLGTTEDVKIQQEYFQDIEENAAIANQEVSFMEIGQEVGFENPWLIFQIYADSITQQCTDATVPDWIDRLGGVDLFTYDHCWKITESQRID